MQNIDVRFNASSNFTKVKADMAALEAQAVSLNTTFAKGAYAPAGTVDPAKWRGATSAVNAASRAYRDAASSSGLLNTQQIRTTSEADKYTRSLQKQKLTMSQMWQARKGIMKEVYNDQLRQQRMTAQYWGTDTAGKHVTDITMPKNVPTELDNWRRKMGMFGNVAASAGTQIVNLGKNMQWSGRQLMAGFTYPMAMFGAAAGVMAYKTEDAFARINKVYDLTDEAIHNSTIREKELGDLRVASMDEARKAADKYGSSLSSTLEVEQELAATGLKGKELTSSTDQVQRISALGDIDPKQTTQMIIALQTAFKDTIKDSNDLNNALNFMNAASNATSLSLQDIAEATPRAATGIAQLGGTVQDMTVLLTSMREAGVPAAEAANAIKSASTRILNPVPKAIEFYQKYNIDIKKLAAEANGNLFNFLKALGTAQQKITAGTQGGIKRSAEFIRAQGVASLFGTYQNNRLSASLVNVSDAYAGVHNQASKVMDLAAKTPGQLQKEADQSLGAMIDNMAGDFKRAWHSFQITLAEMGQPFLAAATDVLKVFNKLLGAFNDIDATKKKWLMMAALVMALAGPAIMLTGLFLNLAGQVTKGVGSIAKFIGISKLMTTEEKAAALTTEAVNKAMSDQQRVSSTLVAELDALTLSLQRAEAATKNYRLAEQDATAGAAQVVAAEEEKVAAIEQTVEAQQAAVEQQAKAARAAANRGIYGQFTPTPIVAPTVPSRGNNLRALQEQKVLQEQINKEVAEQNFLNRQMAGQQNLVNQGLAKDAQKRNAILAIQEKTKGAVSGTGLMMGAMGVSMAAMMVSSNHVVDSIAKWTMIGAIAVPAMTALVGSAQAFGTSVMLAAGKWAIIDGEIIAAAGSTGVLTGMVKGFGIALNEALGPIGWAVLGLTAITGVFMAVKHHNDEIAKKQQEYIKKQKEANAAMESSTATIAQNLGKAAGHWSTIKNTGVGSSGGNQGVGGATYKAFDYFKNTDEGKKALGSLDLTNETKTAADLTTEFIRLQVVGKLTAKQARDTMAGMLMAAGENYSKAMDMVDDVYNRIGEASKIDWTGPISDQLTALAGAADKARYHIDTLRPTAVGRGAMPQQPGYSIGGPDPVALAALQNQAKASARIFNEALANAANPREAHKIIKQYMDGALMEWDKGFHDLATSGEQGAGALSELFTKYGVNNGKTFANAFAHNADFVKALDELQGSGQLSNKLSATIDAATKSGQIFEQTVLRPIRDIIPQLSGARADVASFFAAFDTAGIGLSPQEAANKVIAESDNWSRYAAIRKHINDLEQHNPGVDTTKQMLGLQHQLLTSGKSLTKEINTLNKAYGYAEGSNAGEAMFNLLHHVKAEAADADSEVKNINKDLDGLHDQTINIKVNQLGGIMQSGIEGVKDDMISNAQYIFDQTQQGMVDAMQSAHEKASRSLQEAQDRAQRAQQAHQDAVMRAFEARWEKRKNNVQEAYDKQTKAIDNTIKAEQHADDVRQKLFDNEKARLDALAKRNNTQIEFDVAIKTGNLDEAAKIQNNANADAISAEMDREQKNQEAITQRTIDRLEKKRDRLEKQRDKEMKRLDKVEERQRRHLEKMQEAQQRALQKQQEAQTRALEKQQQAEEAAQQRSLELAKKENDMKLDLFKALPAANKKQLVQALHESGLTLKDFGINTLDPRADAWGKYFQDHLVEHMRIAGAQIANDNMWEEVTGKIAKSMLKGFGFANISQFEQFVKTGNLPTKVHQEGTTHAQHGGGLVGSGIKSNMGSLAHRGPTLTASEQMIRAQRGEYLVNAKQAGKYRSVLDSINSGKANLMGRKMSRNGSGYGGLAAGDSMAGGYAVAPFGMAMGTGYRMMTQGMKGTIKNNIAAARESARRQRQEQRRAKQQRNGDSLAVGADGPVTALGQSAINWAANRIGQSGWYQMCLSFVRQAFGAAGGVYDAKASWAGVRNKFGVGDYNKVPAGVPVYWTTGSHGHVALSTGGGGMISTDHPNIDEPGYTSIGSVSSWLGARPAGWGADINGKNVYPLRTGGTIKYDNTLISAHKGETVLPARLTERFKENVRGGGGGNTYQVTVDLRGAMVREDIDIKKAVHAAIDEKQGRLGRKRTVN